MRRVLIDIDKLREMLVEPANNDPYVHHLLAILHKEFEESIRMDFDATTTFAEVLSVESKVRRQLQEQVVNLHMMLPPQPIRKE